jgi:acetyltransferase-like isoleucine patch superfamily enzyme
VRSLSLTSRRSRGRVRIGRDVTLGRGVRFKVGPAATLTLGDGVAVGAGTRFDVAGGGAAVRIGAGTVLGRRCVVAGRERVTIGRRCRLGDEVVLMDFDHAAADHERPVREQGLVTAPVAVGDGAVLDDAAVVLHGATVGPGAHVTTRAVVTRDVAPGATAGGVPARPGD